MKKPQLIAGWQYRPVAAYAFAEVKVAAIKIVPSQLNQQIIPEYMNVYELTVSGGVIKSCVKTDKEYDRWINVSRKGDGTLMVTAQNEFEALISGKIAVKTHAPVAGYGVNLT